MGSITTTSFVEDSPEHREEKIENRMKTVTAYNKKVKTTFMGRALPLLLALLLLIGILGSSLSPLEEVYGATETNTVSFVLTGDLNDCLQSTSMTAEESTTITGGFARIKTVIDSITEEYPSSVVMDVGNFSVGTAYQSIEADYAPQLLLMGQMGYDITTLGAREFSQGLETLTSMLTEAAQGGEEGTTTWTYNLSTWSFEQVTTGGWTMPTLVTPNIDWQSSLSQEDTQDLWDALEAYGAKDYAIVEKDGVRIAVFSLLGYDAMEDAAETGLIWKDPAERATQIVREIQANGEADMIVCLFQNERVSFSGNDSLEEAKAIAREVSGIDLIVAGSDGATGSATVNGTTIVSCGCDGAYVGHVLFEETASGTYSFTSFDLLDVDGSVQQDEDLQETIDAFITQINSTYFSSFGYKYSQKLVTNESAATSVGDLIADAYLYAMQSAEGDSGEEVTVAFVSQEVIGTSLSEGKVTVADIFNLSAVGTGTDGSAGASLVSFYLTGKELKAVVELDASYSQEYPETAFYISGLTYSYNAYRIQGNRAYDIAFLKADGTTEKVDNDTLYRVVCDQATMEILTQASVESNGSLHITPKDSQGATITSTAKAVVKSGKKEMKAWVALADYVQTFSDKVIPASYTTAQAGKVDKTSINPIHLFKSPNRFTLCLLLILIVPILLVLLVVAIYRRHRARRHAREEKRFSGVRRHSIGNKPVFKSKSRAKRKLWR